LDTGPIISQREYPIPIPEDMTAGKLFEILAQMGVDLLVETLPKYITGEIKPEPQEDDKATYAPRLDKEDGKLDFDKPAEYLTRKVRAYNPWPGTFQFYDGKRLQVHKAHAAAMPGAVPGNRYIVDDKPAWGTSRGILILDVVQVAGKTKVTGEAFLRGAKEWINEKEKHQ
jgi:methionyl-tRNA formyltransferase